MWASKRGKKLRIQRLLPTFAAEKEKQQNRRKKSWLYQEHIINKLVECVKWKMWHRASLTQEVMKRRKKTNQNLSGIEFLQSDDWRANTLNECYSILCRSFALFSSLRVHAYICREWFEVLYQYCEEVVSERNRENQINPKNYLPHKIGKHTEKATATINSLVEKSREKNLLPGVWSANILQLYKDKMHSALPLPKLCSHTSVNCKCCVHREILKAWKFVK